MDKNFILLLDDTNDDSLRLVNLLGKKNYSVFQVADPSEALAWLEENHCGLAVLHSLACRQYLPFLSQLAARQPAIPVIAVSQAASVGEASELFKAGVADYLEAPLVGDQFKSALQRAFSLTAAGKASASCRGKGCANIIGESKKMKNVFSLIKKVCDTDTTVLVRGESGTGKELIAQALHYEGSRHNGPFVPVNCGAIPGELLESELFGHEKGAFTHAIRTRIGRFEMAHGGTVFLDEISEMSPMLQVKILRVLQERCFERIGGAKTIESDFRIIAATNRDLEEEVKQGRFREDLYYRLNVIPIEAPPLRERVSDIPLLVDHFIKKFNQTKGKSIEGVADDALEHLLSYPWPGNVRELENMVERMVILTTGNIIKLEDLPERLFEMTNRKTLEDVEEIPPNGFVLSEVVSDFEKRLILQALDQTNWVKNRAAKLLNVNRTTLIEKMKRFDLMNPPASA